MIALRTPLLALLGNPNTGKTTLFNALAGMNQRVGNYPGVTVETKKGKLVFQGQTLEVLDLPGTYSLAARSPDEMLAVDVILGHQAHVGQPDAVIVIVDASNLERNLYLACQVLDLGIPIIIALNMIDVARGQGVKIDTDKLSANLGVPVVPLQANKGVGLEALKEAIVRTLARSAMEGARTHQSLFPEAFENEVAKLRQSLNGNTPDFLVRRLLLDVGGYVETVLVERHGQKLTEELTAARHCLAHAGCPVPAIEARTRYGWIRQATADCLHRPAVRVDNWTDRLDRILTHRYYGTVIFLALMFVVFQSLFYWSRPLMELVSMGVEFLGNQFRDFLPPGPLRSIIVDGVFKGVGGVLVFLPQIMILFAFMSILEDCGYMARAAFLMDRLMSRAGLNGKSFIPLMSSVACAVPGIMAARVIENRRDRLATILVAPLMSCSARLPVYLLLVGAFLSPDPQLPEAYRPIWLPGLVLFGLYCLGLVLAPLVAFLLKRTLLRGETPAFVMEMPLYKVPSLRLVVRRSVEAGWMFVRRAGTMILATMIVIWALLYFPASNAEGVSYEEKIAALEEEKSRENLGADRKDEIDTQINALNAKWKQQSALGRVGKFMEPVFRPLGWDWKIGMAALASFPAREVMVGTLGIIYGEGDVKADELRDAPIGSANPLGRRLREEPIFTVPVALSVLVFFALCCQCASTLVVIRRESNSWAWPAFTFAYMTMLAYVGALITYQVGSLFM